MWCGRKGIDCPYSGVFGKCNRSACGLPNAEPSMLGTSSSYSVNTTTEKSIYDIRREAVKEFAERLKDKFYYVFGNEYEQSVSGFNTKVLIEYIDETLKEFIND